MSTVIEPGISIRLALLHGQRLDLTGHGDIDINLGTHRRKLSVAGGYQSVGPFLKDADVTLKATADDLAIIVIPTVAIVPHISEVFTAETTLDEQQLTVRVDATGGPFTVHLPQASTAIADGIGRVYNIKRIDTTVNVVTIAPFGSELIDGEASLQMDDSLRECFTLQSDGKGWVIL